MYFTLWMYPNQNPENTNNGNWYFSEPKLLVIIQGKIVSSMSVHFFRSIHIIFDKPQDNICCSKPLLYLPCCSHIWHIGKLSCCVSDGPLLDSPCHTYCPPTQKHLHKKCCTLLHCCASGGTVRHPLLGVCVIVIGSPLTSSWHGSQCCHKRMIVICALSG